MATVTVRQYNRFNENNFTNLFSLKRQPALNKIISGKIVTITDLRPSKS